MRYWARVSGIVLLASGCSAWTTASKADDVDSLRTVPIAPIAAGSAARERQPSPGTALALSAAATLVPIGIGATSDESKHFFAYAGAGVVLGPALGYVYGDCAGRGLEGVLIRTLLVGGGVAVVAATSGASGSEEVPALAVSALATASVGSLLLALYDVGVVPEHVQRRNEARSGSLEVTPTLRLARDGAPMVGMSAAWSD